MSLLTRDQVTQLWVSNGGSNNPTVIQQMLAIVGAESGYNTTAVGGGAYGLSQIQGDPKATDPTYAIRKMIAMSSNGTNWAPWCSAWSQPNGNCGHGNPGGVQPGSAAAKYLNGASGVGVPGASPTAQAPGNTQGCFATAPLIGGCIIGKSQLKAVRAALAIGAGAVIMAAGTILLVSGGAKGTGAGRAVVRTASRVPLAGRVPTSYSRPQARPSSSSETIPKRDPNVSNLSPEMRRHRERFKARERAAAPQRSVDETTADVDMF